MGRSSVASAGSTSDLTGPVSSAAGKSNSIRSAVASSKSIGLECLNMQTSATSPDPNWSPSISSVGAIPASHSARPGSAEERTTRGIFGPSSPVSFAYFDPDSCCWKTSQGTFLSALEQFSETWPDSGTMRNGVAYELRTSGPATSGSGCSLWPIWNTPSTEDYKTDGPAALGRYKRGEAMTCDMRLRNQAQTWPRARREDGESCGNHPGAVDSLTGATKTWRTPDAPGTGGPRNHQGSIGAGHQITIAEQAEHWQTPATDSFRSRGGDRKDEMGLDQQARFFPTPSARDYRTPNREAAQHANQLPNFVAHSLPAPQTTDGPKSSESALTSRRLWPTPDTAASGGCKATAGTDLETQKRPDGTKAQIRLQHLTDQGKRRLNPRFVEFLMGLPIGWTEL
jgi:hypothetical protein